MASPNAGAGSNGARPKAPTSTSRSTRSPCPAAKRAATAPPRPRPTSTGGSGQVCVEQLAQPGQHPVGTQRAGRGRRGAVAGQVGGDHPVGGGQAGDDPLPEGGELARAVQQDQRRAVAALQHGGGDGGQLQAPFGDGDAGQQPPAGVVGGCAGRGPRAPAGRLPIGVLLVCGVALALARPTLGRGGRPVIEGTTHQRPAGSVGAFTHRRGARGHHRDVGGADGWGFRRAGARRPRRWRRPARPPRAW